MDQVDLVGTFDLDTIHPHFSSWQLVCCHLVSYLLDRRIAKFRHFVLISTTFWVGRPNTRLDYKIP